MTKYSNFMKILYFGGGFVGACSAAVSADSGHEVLVYDINRELVASLSSGDKDKIEAYLFEKGLGDLIIRNQARIRFSSELSLAEKFAEEAEAVFMCLPTPERDHTAAPVSKNRRIFCRHVTASSSFTDIFW